MKTEPLMDPPSLHGVSQGVVRRAQRQGFVVSRDIREELDLAGVPQTYWKDVLALARPALRYLQGRYYYISPAVLDLRARVRQEQLHLRHVQRTVRQLIRLYKAKAAQVEQREHNRTDFILPVKVLTEDHRELRFLSRDISLSGICLLGNCSLLGQKVRLLLPRCDKNKGPQCFAVRIVWASTVADGLVQQGGVFLELVADSESHLKDGA